MTTAFAPTLSRGYNAPVKENKTDRVNAMLKPSVKRMLAECADALRLSEADALAVAIVTLRESKKIREALAKQDAAKKGSE